MFTGSGDGPKIGVFMVDSCHLGFITCLVTCEIYTQFSPGLFVRKKNIRTFASDWL